MALAFVLGLVPLAQAGTIKLAWDPSPTAGVLGYVVLYGVVPGQYPYSLDVGNQTSAAVPGLAGGPTYYFAVVAYEAYSFSQPSNVVTGTTTNLPPVVTSPGDHQSTEGDAIQLQVVASDPDGDPLTYSASGLPDGLTLDGVSGLIYGTVSSSAFGTYPVTLTVSDGSLSVSVSFNWLVFASTPAPSNPVDAVVAIQ